MAIRTVSYYSTRVGEEIRADHCRDHIFNVVVGLERDHASVNLLLVGDLWAEVGILKANGRRDANYCK